MTRVVPMTTQEISQDEATIRSMWKQFEDAFNRNDAAKVASLYAADGDRINSNFELAKGRQEIATQYEKEFAKRKADPTTVPFHAEITIRLLNPQIAILDGEWQGVQQGKNVGGQFTGVLKRSASGWEIAAGRVRGVKEP